MARRRAPLTSLSKYDLPIKGAADPELTVLGFFESVCKKERDRQQKLIDQAKIRERYMLGDQWSNSAHDPLTQEILADEDARAYLTQENLLMPLGETWAARVDQGRVQPRVAPHDSESGDVGSAEAGNMLLDALRAKNDERTLISDAAMNVQYHGDVLFYPTWDESMTARVRRQKTNPNEGFGETLAFDPMGQPVMEIVDEKGEVRLEAIPATRYWDSGEDDEEKARWRVVERMIDEDTAKEIVKNAIAAQAKQRAIAEGADEETAEQAGHEAGEAAPDPKSDGESTAAGIDWHGVFAYEVWVKPGALAKEGFYFLLVGGVPCVLREPYPYQHGELPGSVWKCLKISGSPRGGTHVTRAIHQQRGLNGANLAIVSRINFARDCAVIGPSALIEQWKVVGKKLIKNDNPSAKIDAYEGKPIPESLFKAADKFKTALYDTFGVSEATASGGDPTETNSGAQLRNATALDAQKIAGPRSRLENALKRCARQMLALAIQHYEFARLVRVTDPSGETRARWLSSADLKGADLLVEIGSGAYNTRLGGQRAAEEGTQAGYLTPQQGKEMRQTGLDETVGAGQQRARIHAQIGQVMSGQPAQPLPDVDPAVGAQHVRNAISALASSGANVAPLLDLLAAYEDAAQQKAMQPPPGGMPPKPGQAPAPQQAAPKAGATKFTAEAAKAPTQIQ